MKHYQLIPIKFWMILANKKLTKPGRLLVFLKFKHSGYFIGGTEEISVIAKALGVTERTIKNNLKKLIELNWIGFNKNRKAYFVRSIYKIIRNYPELGSSNKIRCSKFYKEDIKHFKEYAYATLYGSVSNRKYLKEVYFRKEQPNAQRGCSPQAATTEWYQPVAIRYITQMVCVSASTIQRNKAKAVSAGLLLVKKQFKSINFTERFISFRMDDPSLRNIRKTKITEEYKLRTTDLIATPIEFRTPRAYSGK